MLTLILLPNSLLDILLDNMSNVAELRPGFCACATL